MPDIPISHRWVATRTSSRRAARAFFLMTLRRPRLWILFGLVELAFAVVFSLAVEGGYSPAGRVFWGVVLALLPTLVFALGVLAVAHLLNLRFFRKRLREGTVLESGIGDRAVLLRGPWSESTISFEGIASVRRVGDWVFLQQVGVPIVGVWPADLIPDDGLARIQRAVAAR